MTRLGYQIPNFTYPGVDNAGLFEVVARQAEEADASGFDTVMVMDHFYQLPMIGQPDEFMLECYSLLAALAGRTERVRLSALVTGNTYRNPAMLAKTVTTLDVISGGRATLGIGAGWFELEHDSMGFEFGTFTDRFRKLEEALQIIIPMLRGERPSFEGDHYRVTEAINEPPPVSRIPIIIGGQGEKKTLRMVAQYADASNLTATLADVPRKLEALAGHCEALGRDRSELTVTIQQYCCVADTREQARRDMAEFFGARGLDLDAMPEEDATRFLDVFVWGSPDEVGEKLTRVLDAGLDGVTLCLPANGHVPGRVELLGQVAAPIFVS